MSTRNVSPGGALLRASRLFSIPQPISRPTTELTSQAVFHSPSSTIPHPTHLSITTPASSLSKGDWGLKRPLPLRSTTKSSTPLIRVNSVDTLEHITDYQSSADHSLTLQKWQEMDIPLTTPKPKVDSVRQTILTGGKGVFEEGLDGRSEDENKRWRFEGPWLPGQTVGEFNEYLLKEVRKRKGAFREFLREEKALRDTSKSQRLARERGENLASEIKPSDVTDEQLEYHIRELRQDRRALFSIIRKFLDLPPAPTSRALEDDFNDIMGDFGIKSGRASPRTLRIEEFLPKPGSRSPFAETGPPRTHPSAGLSYLRSGAYVFNHPIYGPQANPPPVEARIVMPKGASVGTFAPKLGVGGVVTEIPSEAGFNTGSLGKRYQAGRMTKESNPGLLNIEPDKYGGSKVWVKPTLASIDTKGRISLTVAGAAAAAVAIQGGRTGDDLPTTVRRPYVPPPPLPPPARMTNQGYGLKSTDMFGGLPDLFGERAQTTREPTDRQDIKGAGGSKIPSSRATLSNDDAMKALQGLLDGRYDDK